MAVSFRRRIVLLMWYCTSSLLLFPSPLSPSSGRLGRVSGAWLKIFTRTPRNSAPWGPTCTGATGRVFPAAIVYLLAPSFPKVNSDRRYLGVDSELRREASCLWGGSWVSNVSRGEMFEGIVAPTFLGWDQHGLPCLLFGVSSKFEGTHASPQNHPEHGMDGHCFRGQRVLSHWFVRFCIH